MNTMKNYKHFGSQLSPHQKQQRSLYKDNHISHLEAGNKLLFSNGKSSSCLIKELRRQKLEYEKETGHSLTRCEIGHRL